MASWGLGRSCCLNSLGGQVAEAAVGPDGVVVDAPGLDEDGRFAPGSEPLDAQTFVPELAVEAFIGAILPRLAGVLDASRRLRWPWPRADLPLAGRSTNTR